MVELRGKAVTFAFYARTDSTEITTLRACVGEWDGTADSVTSDVVSSWGATPTWIANFECINTPSDITISSSWTQTSIAATLETDFNNLVMLVWTPNTEAQNDDFYLAQPQLVQGSSALDWSKISLSYTTDLREVQRYYQKTYDVDTAPGTGSTPNGYVVGGMGPNGAYITANGSWGVVMRSTPSCTFYDLAGSSGAATIFSGGAWSQSNGQTPAANGCFNYGHFERLSNGAGSSQALAYHVVANAEL